MLVLLKYKNYFKSKKSSGADKLDLFSLNTIIKATLNIVIRYILKSRAKTGFWCGSYVESYNG